MRQALSKPTSAPPQFSTRWSVNSTCKATRPHAPRQLRQRFRDTLTPVLARLMQDADIAQRLTAAFQTEVLGQLAQIESQLDTLVTVSADKARELHLTEQLFIGLARRIARDVDNIDDAHRELEAAVARAAEMERQARLPSNLGAQINTVLAKVARLNGQDELDAAAQLIEAELAETDAHKSRLLTLATDQALLSRDAATAARHLVARADLDAGGRATFDDLRKICSKWRDRGQQQGLNLDLEVSIDLARLICARATNADERGIALNDLGTSLANRGERDATHDRLHEAATVYKSALSEHTREHAPLQWAMTQGNLARVSVSLFDLTGEPPYLDTAQEHIDRAVKVFTATGADGFIATAQNVQAKTNARRRQGAAVAPPPAG